MRSVRSVRSWLWEERCCSNGAQIYIANATRSCSTLSWHSRTWGFYSFRTHIQFWTSHVPKAAASTVNPTVIQFLSHHPAIKAPVTAFPQLHSIILYIKLRWLWKGGRHIALQSCMILKLHSPALTHPCDKICNSNARFPPGLSGANTPYLLLSTSLPLPYWPHNATHPRTAEFDRTNNTMRWMNECAVQILVRDHIYHLPRARHSL